MMDLGSCVPLLVLALAIKFETIFGAPFAARKRKSLLVSATDLKVSADRILAPALNEIPLACWANFSTNATMEWRRLRPGMDTSFPTGRSHPLDELGVEALYNRSDLVGIRHEFYRPYEDKMVIQHITYLIPCFTENSSGHYVCVFISDLHTLFRIISVTLTEQSIIPPKTLSIDSYCNGSVVEVPFEQSFLQLTCILAFGNPAAVLTWFRNGDTVTEGVANSTEVVGDNSQQARSVLTINPRGEDNGAVFTCKSENLDPLVTSVELSITHPPGMPVITGYQKGQLVETGNTLGLLCSSSGGNPPAQVYWYKDGEDLDFSYFSPANTTQNELVFTIQPSDNNAVYRCEASNTLTPTPLFTEIRLVAQFAPAEVTISGHQHAKPGDTIQLSCESAISNPPAVITWFSRGREVQVEEWEEIPSPQGGYVTMSNITVTLTDQEHNVMYQCNGTNEALGETVVDNITLTLMYAPVIDESPELCKVAAEKGSLANLICCAEGAPAVKFKWYKDDTEFDTADYNDKYSENSVELGLVSYQSTLSVFNISNDDYGNYTCQAFNDLGVDRCRIILDGTTTLPADNMAPFIIPMVSIIGLLLLAVILGIVWWQCSSGQGDGCFKFLRRWSARNPKSPCV